MESGFSFSDAGRTFTCCVEPMRHDGGRAWWWFAVSTEAHQRHACFRHADGDTAEDVGPRIVAFYDEMKARRDAPWQPHWRRKAPASNAPVAAEAEPQTPSPSQASA